MRILKDYVDYYLFHKSKINIFVDDRVVNSIISQIICVAVNGSPKDEKSILLIYYGDPLDKEIMDGINESLQGILSEVHDRIIEKNYLSRSFVKAWEADTRDKIVQILKILHELGAKATLLMYSPLEEHRYNIPEIFNRKYSSGLLEQNDDINEL